jgi:hypothetical protein
MGPFGAKDRNFLVFGGEDLLKAVGEHD